MWIPHKPRDLEIEKIAKEIITAARDAELTCPEGHWRTVGVKFKTSAEAQRVTDCLVERYGAPYEHMIRIELFH